MDLEEGSQGRVDIIWLTGRGVIDSNGVLTALNINHPSAILTGQESAADVEARPRSGTDRYPLKNLLNFSASSVALIITILRGRSELDVSRALPLPLTLPSGR